MTAIEGARRRRETTGMERHIRGRQSSEGTEGKAVPDLKVIGGEASRPAPIATFIDKVSSKGPGGTMVVEGLLITRWFDDTGVDPQGGGCGRCAKCQATVGPRGIVRCTLIVAGDRTMSEAEAANYSPEGEQAGP
jgi:hypothetical protein